MFRDWKTNLSWLILVAGAIWGLSQTAGRGFAQEAQTVLGWAYAAWALFWGVPPFLKWWGHYWVTLPAMTGCLPGGCLLQAMLVTAVLALGGPFYCLFGGGIYQFVRHQFAIRP